MLAGYMDKFEEQLRVRLPHLAAHFEVYEGVMFLPFFFHYISVFIVEELDFYQRRICVAFCLIFVVFLGCIKTLKLATVRSSGGCTSL